jgi:hypothetical protein
MGRTNDHTGRFQAKIGAVGAIVAFGGGTGFRIHIDGVIGAGLHTSLAADTDTAIELYNSIMPLVHGSHGANTDTGRIGAVIAARHLKETAGIGELPFFYILDPGPADPERNFIFRLTGDTTSVTTNTSPVVDNKAKIHFTLPCVK